MRDHIVQQRCLLNVPANIASVMSILFLDNVVIDVFVIGLLTVTSILSIF